MTDRPLAPMWSDNETGEDLLGFDTLTASIVQLVTRDELLPLTIGVYGDWGSGKSSLMRMARAGLDQSKVVTVLFSPWQHEDYSDVRSALMSAVVDSLEAKQSVVKKLEGAAAGQVAMLIKALRRRINVFQLIGLATTAAPAVVAAVSGDQTFMDAARIMPQVLPAIAAGADAADKTVEREQERAEAETAETAQGRVGAFRRDLEELITSTGVDRVVIFIDDLDRCLPDNIVSLLEIVKLFLAVPMTAFVIGADERLVRHAVARRYPDIGDDEDSVSRDYLEKMIQIPIRIPPMTPGETETYLNLLGCGAHLDLDSSRKIRTFIAKRRAGGAIDKPLAVSDIEAELEDCPLALREHFAVIALIAPVIGVKMKGNPRQTKRFLNTLNHRIELAARRGVELKPAVLAKLMLLEYFYDSEFRTLFSAIGEGAGAPAGMGELERLAREGAAAPLADGKGVPVKLQDWLSDPDLTGWLAAEPSLDGVNLAPYFYYSRDRVALGPLAGLGLPQHLQEILRSLLSATEIERELGAKRATELPDEELKALFSAICARLARDPDEASGDLLKRALELAHKHEHLVPELVRTLQSVSTTKLLTSLPATIAAKWNRRPPEAIRGLLRGWVDQKENLALAALARKSLEQLQ